MVTKHVRYNLKRLYGITPEQREALLAKQRKRCALCGLKKVLVIDHDHDTGQIRGLLCNKCNLVVDLFEKSPVGPIALFRAVMNYLGKGIKVEVF